MKFFTAYVLCALLCVQLSRYGVKLRAAGPTSAEMRRLILQFCCDNSLREDVGIQPCRRRSLRSSGGELDCLQCSVFVSTSVMGIGTSSLEYVRKDVKLSHSPESFRCGVFTTVLRVEFFSGGQSIRRRHGRPLSEKACANAG